MRHTRYWTTDLDVVDARSLAWLRRAAPGVDLFVVNAFKQGRTFRMGLETNTSHRSPNAHARAFISAIAALPPKTRERLVACGSRTLAIAFEMDGRPPRFEMGLLSPATLNALAKLRIGVAITLYAADD